MSSSTASATSVNRVFNFNAGPSALPLSVLERIREELLDWRGSGMSVMEMSHRSPEFESINAAAEAGLRKHLAIPDDYGVIFVQGGGSTQFTIAPMNLCLPGKPVDLLHTGTWTAKALTELKKGIAHRVAATTEPVKFTRVPRKDEISLSPDASYVHLCTNNTIEGTQYHSLPDTGEVPIVADMSSDIASRPLDVSKFGLIFAGAQKNRPFRRDRRDRAQRFGGTRRQEPPDHFSIPHAHQGKIPYHTPPTFAIYIVGLMMEWIESQGGLMGIQKRNDRKAKLLYDTIDASNGFYHCPVEKDSRSLMNVVFRAAGASGQSAATHPDEAAEKEFGKQAAAAGLAGTPGHRSVGGMRISLYNAVEPEAVEALTSFMREFHRKRG